MFKYKVDVQPIIMKKPLVEQPLRVAAYCRVNTDSDEELGSLESQIKFYTEYIQNSLTGDSSRSIQTRPLVSV